MIINYLNYFIKSKKNNFSDYNPYLQNLAVKILNFSKTTKKNIKIERLRYKLLKNNKLISTNDLGAGSKQNSSNNRKISDIAKYSLTPAKYSLLIKEIIEYTTAKNVLELGTSLGITSLYMKTAKTNPSVTTIEGCKNIANLAKKNFKLLKKDIKIYNLSFDDFFKKAIKNNLTFDFFYIDGNHTKKSTIKYFEDIKKINSNGTLVFDDIRWSKNMYEAWTKIRKSNFKGAVVELLKVGIIFFNDSFDKKEYLILNFF